MKAQTKKFVYYGTVLDDELFTDNSVPHLPVGHIILLSELKKIVAVSTTPDALKNIDLGVYYKVAAVKTIEPPAFFHRLFRLPAPRFVEFSFLNGHGECKTIWIREEVAEKLQVEVSRKAHQG